MFATDGNYEDALKMAIVESLTERYETACDT